MSRGRATRAGALPAIAVVLLLALPATVLRAEPLVPASDAEVVERLPAAGRGATQARLARRQLAARPDDAALAVRIARAGLDKARASGDPRHAGLALAALAHWADAQTAPPEVLLLQATLDQHLHDFDAAAAKLELLLRRHPGDAQAWLTLASVRRVQGRYADSDAACSGVARAGATLHAAACSAENDGLRGRFARARETLQRLEARPGLDGATRAWLQTTRAELEQRAGDLPAADAAWRAAQRADADPYAALGHADFLVGIGQLSAARAVLAQQPDSDAVLLARENLQRQREPIDLWLLAEAARAAGDRTAHDEALRLAAAQGFVDTRWTTRTGWSPT